MYNVEFEVQGDQLIIRIDLNQELGVSSSGKSVIIATTGGNVAVAGGEAVKVGVNVYRPQQAGRTSRRIASQWEEVKQYEKWTSDLVGVSDRHGVVVPVPVFALGT